MARKSPLQLYQMALALHRDGWPAEQIADQLGLHPGSVLLWVDWPHHASRTVQDPSQRTPGHSRLPGVTGAIQAQQ